MTGGKVQGCERADHLQSTMARYNHAPPVRPLAKGWLEVRTQVIDLQLFSREDFSKPFVLSSLVENVESVDRLFK
jgi:hypothetical protein